MKFKKLPAPLAGLIQAFLISGYVVLVGLFIQTIGQKVQQPYLLGTVLFLILLVISAAITGILFFGLPLYLVLDRQWPKALKVIGYTMLFSFLIIACLVIILLGLI